MALPSVVAGLATVHSLERTIRLARAWRARTAPRDRRALLSEVRADRERVVTAAEATVGADRPRPADAPGGDAAATRQ